MTTEPTPQMRAVAGDTGGRSGAYRQRGADGATKLRATPAPCVATGWDGSSLSIANPTPSTRSA